MTTESGVLSDTRYSFHTRFAQGIGTNPDELIAASLGGCFSMFLANELGLSGFHPQRIETTATATPSDAITFDHLDWGRVTGLLPFWRLSLTRRHGTFLPRFNKEMNETKKRSFRSVNIWTFLPLF